MIFFLDFDRTLFDTEKFYNALERALIVPGNPVTVEDLARYLYADSIPFLEERTRAGDICILVSRGEVVIQKTKAENSAIIPYLSDALYVGPGKSKGDAIQTYLNMHPGTQKSFFLDDTITELEQVAEKCSDVTVVRMRRVTARNAGQEAPHLAEVKDFAGLKALLI